VSRLNPLHQFAVRGQVQQSQTRSLPFRFQSRFLSHRRLLTHLKARNRSVHCEEVRPPGSVKNLSGLGEVDPHISRRDRIYAQKTMSTDTILRLWRSDHHVDGLVGLINLKVRTGHDPSYPLARIGLREVRQPSDPFSTLHLEESTSLKRRIALAGASGDNREARHSDIRGSIRRSPIWY